jgi:hypothetical protein
MYDIVRHIVCIFGFFYFVCLTYNLVYDVDVFGVIFLTILANRFDIVRHAYDSDIMYDIMYDIVKTYDIVGFFKKIYCSCIS